MENVEFKVEGMDCEGCVKSVTRMLTGIAGVSKVDVSLKDANAKVGSSVRHDASHPGMRLGRSTSPCARSSTSASTSSRSMRPATSISSSSRKPPRTITERNACTRSSPAR